MAVCSVTARPGIDSEWSLLSSSVPLTRTLKQLLKGRKSVVASSVKCPDQLNKTTSIALECNGVRPKCKEIAFYFFLPSKSARFILEVSMGGF